jgi:hypothetical protein
MPESFALFQRLLTKGNLPRTHVYVPRHTAARALLARCANQTVVSETHGCRRE